MKIRKQYIIIEFVLIVILALVILHFNLNNKKELPINIENQQNQIKTDLNIKPQTEIPIKEKENKEIPQTLADKNSIKVSLIVSDKKYDTNIKENASVFDAMDKIQKESAPVNIFNFKYTNNASLGNFIIEINGSKGTPGKYWIYYVNNKKASVGVSNYILKEGDIIKWSQEGI